MSDEQIDEERMNKGRWVFQRLDDAVSACRALINQVKSIIEASGGKLTPKETEAVVGCLGTAAFGLKRVSDSIGHILSVDNEDELPKNLN